MNPEDQLRRLADDDRWADHDAWRELQVPDSRERQAPSHGISWIKRWMPAAAAAVAVAAGVIVAVHLSDNGSPPPAADGDSPIPWKPLTPQNDLVLAAQNATCDPSTLAASSSAPSVVMDAYHLKISVSNSGLDCALPNDQVVLRTSSGGSEVTLARATGDRPDAAPTLAQGATIDYYVEFDPSCTASAAGQPQTNPVAIGVGATDVKVDGTALPDALVSCSSVHLTAPPSENDEEAYPGLSASMNLPDSTSGTTLDYTVALTNSSKESITFTTCPDYKETSSVYNKGKASETYQLNCADARTIPAGSTVRYAMKLHMPAAHGGLKVGWFLDHGPSTAGSLTRK